MLNITQTITRESTSTPLPAIFPAFLSAIPKSTTQHHDPDASNKIGHALPLGLLWGYGLISSVVTFSLLCSRALKAGKGDLGLMYAGLAFASVLFWPIILPGFLFLYVQLTRSQDRLSQSSISQAVASQQTPLQLPITQRRNSSITFHPGCNSSGQNSSYCSTLHFTPTTLIMGEQTSEHFAHVNPPSM